MARFRVLTTGVVLLVLAGCGGQNSGSSAHQVSDDGSLALAELLRARSDLNEIDPGASIVDALPGAQADAASSSTAVVIAAVQGIQQGTAYKIGDAGSDVALDDYDSAEADLRTAQVDLRLLQVPCGPADINGAIGIEVPFGATTKYEAVEAIFNDLGRIVVFVDSWPGDPAGVFHLGSTQMLLTPVNESGGLAWDAMRGRVPDAWFAGGSTIEELERNCPLVESD